MRFELLNKDDTLVCAVETHSQEMFFAIISAAIEQGEIELDVPQNRNIYFGKTIDILQPKDGVHKFKYRI